MRSIPAAVFLIWATVAASASMVAESLVRIEATSQSPDYKAPWNPGSVESGVGTGFVIAGDRILTNAHVVSNARFLTVSKEGDSRPYSARVLHIAHDCDLAMLAVDAPEFFNGTTALEFGGIPAIESTVSVYGYPIGGTRLSVTRGIVSRIDFQPYSHSGMDSHLTIQIDAAINPGNSGGPVLQKGKVVGVAFQGYSGEVAQNVGYMIPTPVVLRFLQDVEDGRYDRYMDLALTYEPLFNPAARKALGVTQEDRGVLVGSVYAGGSSEGHIREGDVLLSIDGLPISSDGSIPLDNDRVPFTEIVERKFKGDSVVIELLRENKPLEVKVPLANPWPFVLQSNLYDEKPRFLIFGGLVFQPVDKNFMEAHTPGAAKLKYLFEYFIEDGIHRTKPELVVLGSILPDSVNSYAEDFRYEVVSKINGRAVRDLADVDAALQEKHEFHTIEFEGNGRPLVLEAKAVADSRARIQKRYGIVSEKNL